MTDDRSAEIRQGRRDADRDPPRPTMGPTMGSARLAVGEISPMVVTFLRWAVCCVALTLTSRREMREFSC